MTLYGFTARRSIPALLVVLFCGVACEPIPARDQLPTSIRTIPAPPGYVRTGVPDESFADYLRGLKLLPSRTVYLYNGQRKGNQSAQFAVVDLSVGDRDLQQCADAILRLRAEFHLASQEPERIAYHFTSGDLFRFDQWAKGYRPAISGNRVTFNRVAQPDWSRRSFDRYLQTLFTYAGTISLRSDSVARGREERPQIGDFFLQSGSPGHAVIILDMVRKERGRQGDSPEYLYLLGQSYMPAQQFHVLKNPHEKGDSVPGFESEGAVWYSLERGGAVNTPEWSFPPGSLRYFAR
jgi:hypothetical protein